MWAPGPRSFLIVLSHSGGVGRSGGNAEAQATVTCHSSTQVSLHAVIANIGSPSRTAGSSSNSETQSCSMARNKPPGRLQSSTPLAVTEAADAVRYTR